MATVELYGHTGTQDLSPYLKLRVERLIQEAMSGIGSGGDTWAKGTLPDSSDFNTVRTQGIYSVPTVTAAGSMLNCPTRRAGILRVESNTDTSITIQSYEAYVSTTASPETYIRSTLTSASTGWSPWVTKGWHKGLLPDSTNLQTWRNPGVHGIGSNTSANTMLDMPLDANGAVIAGPGHLEVIPTISSGRTMQRLTMEVSGKIRVWGRTTGLTSSFPAWQELTAPTIAAGAGDSVVSRTADVQVSDHASRVEYARARRGGSIGTGGKPVFMWRFDHWLVDFKNKVLPILREFNLPATLNVNYDNLGIAANGAGSIPWSEVQDWNQYDGIEIANHGSTHTNASTMADIYHEVVDGRRNLEKAMPRVAVETWHEHGSAYLIASDLAGDTGLNLGRTPEAFFESYAGRLVMAEHAIVEGKTGSFYPPLTGHPQIGQSHYSMDRQTSQESIDTIKYAQAVGRGLTGYTHPGLMDGVNIGGKIFYATYNTDGSVDLAYPAGSSTHYDTEQALRDWATTNGHIVHMPVKDFRATCAWIAAERDAGRLMVMTAAGGAFADKSHARRENLLVSPTFEDTSQWRSLTDWTITSAGPNVVLKSGPAATRFTQSMLLFTRFGWAMGATHELLVKVKAATATELLLRVEETGNATNWVASKNYSVPGDGVLREYRLNLTLPRDRSITQMTVYIGGASMEIHGPPLLAAI